MVRDQSRAESLLEALWQGTYDLLGRAAGKSETVKGHGGYARHLGFESLTLGQSTGLLLTCQRTHSV